MRITPFTLALFSFAAVACSGNATSTGVLGEGGAKDAAAGGPEGSGGSPIIIATNDAGSIATADAGPALPTAITATIRDFRFYDAGDPTTNPDFENPPYNVDENGNSSPGYQGPWDDRAIVGSTLGADATPVYIGDPTKGTLTTHGNGQTGGAAANFNAWYHDTPGTNITVQWPVPMVINSDGSAEYDSATQGEPYGNTPDGTISGNGFFPIDDGTTYATSFGNEGWPNNYSFTCEIHTVFVYHGGEYFNFRGDDDVYVFINRQLVINLGGVHGPEAANVDVDSLGLTVGKEYPLDYFSAERHVTGSNILFQTTLALRGAPPQ